MNRAAAIDPAPAGGAALPSRGGAARLLRSPRLRGEARILAAVAVVFLGFYLLPAGSPRLAGAIHESLELTKAYAREHVLLCLVPAFLIAGAISVFVSRESVIRYLGAGASPFVAYPVAAVSGTVLAVCSCTVLPLFAGIHRRGAGLGPAIAFLYAGPAINVLAILLTARVLGVELGAARAIGAVAFSVVIGLLMHVLFARGRPAESAPPPAGTVEGGGIGGAGLLVGSMTAFLVFANWARPPEPSGAWWTVYTIKWPLALASLLAVVARAARRRREIAPWLDSSWTLAKQILPLLLAGVLAAGLLLGRPGDEALIPSAWVVAAVGGNSILANLFAATAGAFMYFATLTEIPIVQGLLGSGMGKGPALALLLAGPALSLPSMLVIRSVLGTRRALTYIALVIVMATLSGLLYGAVAGQE